MDSTENTSKVPSSPIFFIPVIDHRQVEPEQQQLLLSAPSVSSSSTGQKRKLMEEGNDAHLVDSHLDKNNNKRLRLNQQIGSSVELENTSERLPSSTDDDSPSIPIALLSPVPSKTCWLVPLLLRSHHLQQRLPSSIRKRNRVLRRRQRSDD